MSKLSDKCQDIVLRYKAGDKEAINELPEYIEPLITSLLKPYKNYDDVEDLRQIAWVTIMKGVEKYNTNSNCAFTTYIYKAIIYELSAYRRKEDKYKNNYDDKNNCVFSMVRLDANINRGDSKIKVVDTLPSDYNLENEVLKHLNVEIMHDILNTLSEPRYTIIKMYLDGQTQSDIAKATGYSSGYISILVKRFINMCVDKVNK